LLTRGEQHVIRAEQTAEGQHLRRYYPLELLRQENPVFALTWTIFRSSPVVGRWLCVLNSAIVVMKAAEERRGSDRAHALDGTKDRSVFVERPMSPQPFIVGGILRQNPA
jgi:hypothetical protein